jgi:hypothetical protein
VGHRAVWQQALEGFNVQQLDIVREWKDEARVEEKRTDLLTVLQKRFHPEVPEDLARVIQQTTDLRLLSRWFVASLESASLDAFRNAMQSPPANP